MDISANILACQSLVLTLTDSIAQLQHSIRRNSGFAFCQRYDQPALHGAEARQAIAEHLGQLRYSGDREHDSSPIDQYMTMALAPETLALLNSTNRAKKSLQQWHEHLARQQDNVRKAAELKRLILKRAGEPLFNLQMADRALIWLPGQPTRMSWHYNTTINSRRKTLSDALNALDSLADQLPQHRQWEIEASRSMLANTALDTPVAHRPSKPVTHLKCRYRYIGSDGEPVRSVCYARNPLFFPDTKHQPPTLVLPPEIHGNHARAGAGRPSLISDIALCDLLPNWLWYKEQATQ